MKLAPEAVKATLKTLFDDKELSLIWSGLIALRWNFDDDDHEEDEARREALTEVFE